MSRRTRAILILVGAFTIWLVLSPFVSGFLIVERPLDRSEAIVVLSGSAAYRERCQKAAELYNKDVAPIVYVSNDGLRAGWSNLENRNPFFVDLAQRELIANGVMPEAIRVLDGYVAGTDEEAAAMAREVEARPVRSIVLVTSPYHSRRTLFAFERVLDRHGVAVGIAHTRVEDLNPAPAWWWTSFNSGREVMAEYVKLAAYWLYF